MLYVTDGNLDCRFSRFEVSLGSKKMKSQRIQHEETKPVSSYLFTNKIIDVNYRKAKICPRSLF